MSNTEHKQVEITVFENKEEYKINVDKGLESVIKNCFRWDFPTNNSCIDNNGMIWICFDYFSDVTRIMQLSLANNTYINGGGWKRETLFEYLSEKAEFDICFSENVIFDPNEEDTVIGDGTLGHGVSLRFPKEDFKTFKKLFFEVFPNK